MVNGFYVKGLSTDYNIDGAGGKSDVNNYYMLVYHNDGTTNSIIGRTVNKLA